MACIVVVVVTRTWMAILIALGWSFGRCAGLGSSNAVKSDTIAEYCSGYTDKHGQWNNGFFCPRWGRSDQVYCCGPEDNRYCCPRQRDTQTETSNEYSLHDPLLVGLSVAVVISLSIASVALCYCCPCCFIYRRRKTRFSDRSTNSIADWHVATTANPIQYESSDPDPRPLDTRTLNPPPYDDNDTNAPPNYASIYKTQGPPYCYYSSVFKAPRQRSVQIASSQNEPNEHRRHSSQRHVLLPDQQTMQANATHSEQPPTVEEQSRSTQVTASLPSHNRPKRNAQRESSESESVVRPTPVKPSNPEALIPPTNSSRQTEEEQREHNRSKPEGNGHHVCNSELLQLTANSFYE